MCANTEGGDALLLADPWPQLRCPSPLPTLISCDETEEQSQHSQEALPHEDDGGGGGPQVLPPTALRTAGNQLNRVARENVYSATRSTKPVLFLLSRFIDIEEVPVSDGGGGGGDGDAFEPAVPDEQLSPCCRRPREMAVVASPARKRSLQWRRRPPSPKDAEETVAASGGDGEQARRPRAGTSFSATSCSWAQL